MIAKSSGAILLGLNALPIQVECGLLKGLPSFQIIGLAKGAVAEAKERVRASLASLGISFPPKRIVVNLSPADVPKEGGLLDLAISVALLTALGYLPEREDTIFLGELGLDGTVRSSRGVFSAVTSLASKGYERFVVPYDEAELLAFLNIQVWGIRHIGELRDVLSGASSPFPRRHLSELMSSQVELSTFWQVRGHSYQKWALKVAAAGAHNLLMIGPPGTGKSMLAKSIVDILPPLTLEEYLEVESIYSLTGTTYRSLRPPLRAPHHTSSYAAVIGGGSGAYPGEISLAHRGVLLMDEFPEFRRDVIEALRGPLEDGVVTISRAEVKVTLPANFSLIATMNPCPCGYLGEDRCRCTPREVRNYWRKISGPILDRFDMVLEVGRVSWQEMREDKGSPDEALRAREEVRIARERLKRWLGKLPSQLAPAELEAIIESSSPEIERLVRGLYERGASLRRLHRCLRVAATIAALRGREHVSEEDVMEAVALAPDTDATWMRAGLIY